MKKIIATLLDREFFNVEIINEFERSEEKYLMPAKMNDKIKEIKAIELKQKLSWNSA